ncbi:MAG: hypothetical protein AMS19_06510 [Gemmatimonas sp. SG8_23]|jgi:uncharacterized protein YlxP (DUF503 family)|nr:MAG: hypothetical protein AMS19_06510 [Gemmatimonas sp. SG8_23]
MVVASQTWELSLHGCASLKQKRSVIRSLRDRLRSKFNVSVAETGLQDVHARALLTIAVVSSDGRLVQSVLDKADRLVEEHGVATIVRVDREVY